MKKNNRISAADCLFIVALLFISSPSFSQKNPVLSDAEVASVAVVANQIDIDYAAIALKNTRNAEILKFANTMANDHKAIIAQAVALVTKLGVTPKTNSLSEKLLADAANTKKQLRSKKNNAFDIAYINNEVAYHKAVIGAVETVLIPESENAELKALLQNVVPPLKAHLAHAEMVQKMIIK
ncbi:MAG: DUF4142 domain-containing protein [Chitinophagaceae bacterium]